MAGSTVVTNVSASLSWVRVPAAGSRPTGTITLVGGGQTACLHWPLGKSRADGSCLNRRPQRGGLKQQARSLSYFVFLTSIIHASVPKASVGVNFTQPLNVSLFCVSNCGEESSEISSVISRLVLLCQVSRTSSSLSISRH